MLRKNLQYVAISLKIRLIKRAPNVFPSYPQPPKMVPRPPGSYRPPLCETSPNKRSRVVSVREHGISFGAISRMEDLKETTCRSIVSRSPFQTSSFSRIRSGRPGKLSLRDERHILRVIATNPKITAAQLVVQAVPHVKKKTVYRFLKKSGIQKWRCRKRPLLTDERAAARLGMGPQA